MSSKKSITVTGPYKLFGNDKPTYKVEKVVNSLLHDPGADITTEQVEALCTSEMWTVNILPKGK